MPWELALVRRDGAPLGPTAAVRKEIDRVWVGVVWGREPSLLEKIKDVPEHPLHKTVSAWPPELREKAERAKTIAVCEAGGVFIEMYGLEANPLPRLFVEIRGSEDPSPLLLKLSRATGWGIKELGSGRLLEDDALPAAWDAYRRTL